MSNVTLAEVMSTVEKKVTVLEYYGLLGQFKVVILGANAQNVATLLSNSGAVIHTTFNIVG